MKNNKQGINDELKKLGLHRKTEYNYATGENEVASNLEFTDKDGLSYGNLGIDKPYIVQDTLSNASYYTKKDSKLANKAIKKLNKVPSNNYVISPKFDAYTESPLTSELQKLAQGKKPTIQRIKKNYKHVIKDKQQEIKTFNHDSQHIIKQIDNKKITHKQLHKNFEKLANYEDFEIGTQHLLGMEKKNRLKPLSYKRVHNMISRATNIATNNFQHLNHKLNKITKGNSKQAKLLKKLNINKPSKNKKYNKKQHKLINIKEHDNTTKKPQTNKRNIKRGFQI